MCSQVNDTHAPGHPHDVKENGIHQTRPPSSIALWSVPIVGTFGGGQGSDRGLILNVYCALALDSAVQFILGEQWKKATQTQDQ